MSNAVLALSRGGGVTSSGRHAQTYDTRVQYSLPYRRGIAGRRGSYVYRNHTPGHNRFSPYSNNNIDRLAGACGGGRTRIWFILSKSQSRVRL
jgi:hypothetical protein